MHIKRSNTRILQSLLIHAFLSIRSQDYIEKYHGNFNWICFLKNHFLIKKRVYYRKACLNKISYHFSFSSLSKTQTLDINEIQYQEEA